MMRAGAWVHVRAWSEASLHRHRALARLGASPARGGPGLDRKTSQTGQETQGRSWGL